MTASRELYLTGLFLLFSQISALQTGNSSKTACELSNVTIDFIFNLGNDTFLDRSWYKNSSVAANKIAGLDNSGSWIVESQYSGRVAFNGLGGITLYNVKKTDSENYLFVILTDIYSEDGTATTTVNIYVNPNTSCMPIIENNSAGNITCKISEACPGNDSIQAIWDDGSVGVFKCPSKPVKTKYNCCAKGDPVTYCFNGSLCSEIECNGTDNTTCERELGCGIGLGSGIPCVITIIFVVIYINQGDTYAYKLGLLHGLGFGITFDVGWIIIVSLISTGNKCKLELGLGLGLGSGMPCVIDCIVAMIFMFVEFKDIPHKVNIGKGILTGLLSASVVGIIVVYLLYDKLKADLTCEEQEDKPQKPTDEKPEEIPLGPTDKKNKTKPTGSSSAVSREHVEVQMDQIGVKSDEERPPVIHIRTQNRVESEPINKKTSDRPQPLPPVAVVTEDISKHRPQPPPPENSDVKDQNKRGISANFEDKQGLPTEPPRSSRLPPLSPKQPTVEEEDASKEEPKKKRKKKKKKGQMNEETQVEEMEELQKK